MKILLDPGHGGEKSGASYGGTNEDDVTLAVAFRCSHVLRELGHDVLLTRDRDDDVPLPRRVELMNQYKAQVFVSIHCNAAPSPPGGEGGVRGDSVHGVETYWRDTDEELLARCVQDALVTHCGMADRGTHNDVLRLKKRLTVLNNDKIPCCLVELGYLSNPEDRKQIIENINTFGEVLAHGIDWFTCIRAGVHKTNWPS